MTTSTKSTDAWGPKEDLEHKQFPSGEVKPLTLDQLEEARLAQIGLGEAIARYRQNPHTKALELDDAPDTAHASQE